MSAGMSYLMYHEIQRGTEPTCRADAGYMRYVVREEDFRRQLARIEELGIRGVTVGEGLAAHLSRLVAITFDDGCASDLRIAAPALEQHGFGATFYVTTGFLDTRGFLSSSELRALSERGFEIGCHGATHRYLTDVPPSELAAEIGAAKDRLEEITGRAVEHFSLPGGRGNARVLSEVRSAGFRSLATSEIGLNGNAPYGLKRLAVQRHTTIAEFSQLCVGEGIRRRQFGAAVLRMAKGVLGNTFYDRLRAAALHDGT